jgi:hypothetical protein
MTEDEWLDCTTPALMLEHLKHRATDRKFRLFAAACCRRIWHLIPDPREKGLVEEVERFADGLIPERQLMWASHRLNPWSPSPRPERFAVDVVLACAVPAAYPGAWEGTRHAQAGAVEALAASTGGGGVLWEWGHQMTLVRCLFGNPFLPISLDPASRTPAVVSLAQAAYDERILPAGTLDPDRLAVLSDALEEAGCTDEQILVHLREPSPHVRGCWVLDLLLEKE